MTTNAAHDGEWLNSPLSLIHLNQHRRQYELGGGVSVVPDCWCWPEPIGKDGNKEIYQHITTEADYALRN